MPRGYLQRKGPKVITTRPWASHDLLGVSGTKIDAGSITSDKLDPSLLQGFHLELAAATEKLAPGDAIPFDNSGASLVSFGVEQWSSQTMLALKVACVMRIHARVELRTDTSPVLPGARAQLQMVNSLGNVIAAGFWTDATITSDGVPVVVADLEREVILQAGTDATYSFKFLAQQADGSAVVKWAAQRYSPTSSPPITGTFAEGMVVPRPSSG